MRWYLLKNQQVYGPYVRDQLAAFLHPDDLVAREGAGEWSAAGADPQLADVLAGKVAPLLEWYCSREGQGERGPVTRAAVLALVERGELGVADLVRHANWETGRRLGETKLYLHRGEPEALAGDTSPAVVAAASAAPAPAAPRGLRRLFSRDQLTFELTPAIVAAVIACLVLPTLVMFYASGALPSRRPAGEPGAIYSMTMKGNELKLVMSLPETHRRLDVELTDKEGGLMSRQVMAPMRAVNNTMGEISIEFDRTLDSGDIVLVRVLSNGEVIATRRGAAAFATALDRRSGR